MPSFLSSRTRRSSVIVVALSLAAGVSCNRLPDEPVPLPEMADIGDPVSLPGTPERQFDFWVGDWAVRNFHVERNGDWTSTGLARARIDLVAGGNAVLERWTGEANGELHGFSLRSFDPARGHWVISLNWHGGSPGGFFEMHGVRTGERIELFPPDDRSSTRYTFSRAHEGSAQWDSAVSRDGGTTWINDWVMQFTRTGGPGVLDAANLEIVTPTAERPEETMALDELVGTWSGTARGRSVDGEWSTGGVTVGVTSMIEGLGLLQLTDTTFGDRELIALAWDPGVGAWVGVQADGRAPGLDRLVGAPANGSVVLESRELGHRQSWERIDASSYRWERATLDAEGRWVSILVAQLRRD